MDIITHKLESDCSIVLERFTENFMKLYAETCHLLVFGQKCDSPVTVWTRNAINIYEEKLLEIQIDS